MTNCSPPDVKVPDKSKVTLSRSKPSSFRMDVLIEVEVKGPRVSTVMTSAESVAGDMKNAIKTIATAVRLRSILGPPSVGISRLLSFL
jgi:hypothetical protein